MTMYVVNMLCVNMYVVYKYVLMIANILTTYMFIIIHMFTITMLTTYMCIIIQLFTINMFGLSTFFTKLSLEFTKKFEKFASALRAEATLYIGRVAFLISSCIMENFPWNMAVYVHAY